MRMRTKSTKSEALQKVYRRYKEENGEEPANMAMVARWGVKKGYCSLPRPVDPYASLADDFSKALREEQRLDSDGRSYRVNLAVTIRGSEGRNVTLWGDIDTAQRSFVEKAVKQRREQIVGDCCQLNTDVDHFNNTRAPEDPIQVVLDFRDDVAERDFLRQRRSA